MSGYNVPSSLENMGIFLVRAAIRDQLDVQWLCIIDPAPHWMQHSGQVAPSLTGGSRYWDQESYPWGHYWGQESYPWGHELRRAIPIQQLQHSHRKESSLHLAWTAQQSCSRWGRALIRSKVAWVEG